MSRATRTAVCALLAVAAATGCTGKKHVATTPAPTASATTSAPPSTEAPSTSESTTASATESPSASSDASSPQTASPSPSQTSSSAASATATTPPDVTSESTSALPPADAAQLADARKLLVTGPELGPNWFALEVPADEQQHEQGDLCGTAAAAEKGRLLDTSNEFNSQEFDGAGRQTIARYKPAAAISAARAVLDRLGHCTNVKQDFDGDIAVVTVTPQRANLATFTLKFASGSVTYGAIAITNTADYISTSMSYAVDEPTAAELAGELDLAAQKKLTAAKLD